MLSWIISVFLLPTSIRALGHPKYECGEHGRFEYCIDGIPGCIVGCHCHPGYYFDTETKICEPNAKLVQDYRRLYFGETTRIPLEAYTSDTENNLTPTTLNPIEPQIDNIAKDADDLGDWLYNQFFKTIESQVINKTETVRPPTRRSESGPGNFSKSINKDIKKKSGRRNEGKSRKKLRAQGRKDKKKKETLRRKLLRISEDDSLFDSSDSQDTYTESSSESDYSDTSDSEGTSHESDKDGNGKRCDKDGEHGHRKILMINKKPKLPLPPFIFLPQFETPFYPPIPLPPPPVMPMYPMVPVPPMPPFPYPVTCPDDEKTETTTKKDEPVTEKPDIKPDNKTDKSPNHITTVKLSDTTSPSSSETESTSDPNNESDPTETPSLRNLKKKKNVRLGKTSIADGEQMKKKNKRKKKPITPYLPDPFVDMYNPQDFLMKDFDKDSFISKTKQIEDKSGPSDVDFKYLAQLIHKLGPNDTKKIDDTKWDMITPLRRTLSQIEGTGNHLIKTDDFFQTRRNFDTHVRNLERHDDLYYTKLGQQIASLIRNVDGINGRQSEQVSNSLSNIGVDLHQLGPNLFNQSSSSSLQGSSLQPNQNPYLYNVKKSAPSSSQQILYENYGPRSYWERSVRSLRYPEVLHPKTDNLYKLENRLIIVASTERPLSLTELENILTIMVKAKTQLQKHTNNILIYYLFLKRGHAALTSLTYIRTFTFTVIYNGYYL
ncbi:uncharacterized protein LOC113231529 [Hyposmocoma kahamanoa]|uniref:uncharacterized protein LOC113231529 n=1 Tax=Hyposmocoma kahamanoa TaxID=1477025 RepID=UPI000E6D89A2|nr:uncharacterized protein LOC113231529 [Hyposmocoma kahamanoa]